MVLEGCIGGKASPEYFQTGEAYYRRIYCEALDTVATAITSTFDRPDFEIYRTANSYLILMRQVRAQSAFCTSVFRDIRRPFEPLDDSHHIQGFHGET